jgi:hypothetical protein
MTALRLLAPAALVFALAACAEAPEAEPEAAPMQNAAQTAVPEAEPAAAEEDETLNPLEIAAREVCAAGDEGFAQVLPEGTGFASRGADARVHAAWNLDGETGEAIISTPTLTMDDRLAFDGAVADFLRHNMVAGFDREGLTGAFRYRDGRFCVVQTERAVIEALREAVQTAQDRVDAGE